MIYNNPRQLELSLPDQERVEYWALHPISRAMSSGTLIGVLTNVLFRTGFIFGGLCGGINVLCRPVYKKIDKELTTPEQKTVHYIFASCLPWIVSLGIMHHLHKLTAKAFFKIPPFVALSAAATTQAFSFANCDLLPRTNRE